MILVLTGCSESLPRWRASLDSRPIQTAESFESSPRISIPANLTRFSIENIGTTPIYNPRLRSVGVPDSSNLRSLVVDLWSPDPMIFAISAWKHLSDRLDHYCSAGLGNHWETDAVALLQSYGFACCDQASRALSQVLEAGGIQTRIVAYPEHTVLEAFIQDRWRMFDVDHKVFYTDEAGEIVGSRDLQQRPELITHDPVGFDIQEMRRIYSGEPAYSDFGLPYGVWNSEIDLQLHPSDNLTFYRDIESANPPFELNRLPIYGFDEPPTSDQIPWAVGKLTRKMSENQIDVPSGFPAAAARLLDEDCLDAPVSIVATRFDGTRMQTLLPRHLDQTSFNLSDLFRAPDSPHFASLKLLTDSARCATIKMEFWFVVSRSIFDDLARSDWAEYRDSNSNLKRSVRIGINQISYETHSQGHEIDFGNQIHHLNFSDELPNGFSLKTKGLKRQSWGYSLSAGSGGQAELTFIKPVGASALLWLRDVYPLSQVSVVYDDDPPFDLSGDAVDWQSIGQQIELPGARNARKVTLRLMGRNSTPRFVSFLDDMMVKFGN